MDILHSYWRMDYLRDKPKGEERLNPFVELPLLGDDKKARIIYRSQYVYIVLNKYPYNPGHLLVVPYRKVAELGKLNDEERNDLMATLVYGQQLLEQAFKMDGTNIGFNLGSAAGAGIPQHLHAHIIPRWNGDTNFFPAIGKTKVLAQALDETWEALRKVSAKMRPAST